MENYNLRDSAIRTPLISLQSTGCNNFLLVYFYYCFDSVQFSSLGISLIICRMYLCSLPSIFATVFFIISCHCVSHYFLSSPFFCILKVFMLILPITNSLFYNNKTFSIYMLKSKIRHKVPPAFLKTLNGL